MRASQPVTPVENIHPPGPGGGGSAYNLVAGVVADASLVSGASWGYRGGTPGWAADIYAMPLDCDVVRVTVLTAGTARGPGPYATQPVTLVDRSTCDYATVHFGLVGYGPGGAWIFTPPNISHPDTGPLTAIDTVQSPFPFVGGLSPYFAAASTFGTTAPFSIDAWDPANDVLGSAWIAFQVDDNASAPNHENETSSSGDGSLDYPSAPSGGEGGLVWLATFGAMFPTVALPWAANLAQVRGVT